MISNRHAFHSLGRQLLAAVAACSPLTLGAGAAVAADAGVEATETQIETVTVTARRVEESQQSVPLALTALSPKDLQQLTVFSVQDLQTAVPGLFVGNNTQGNEPTFSIRGAKTGNGTSPTISVYVDDVPVRSNVAVANMVYDMQSITTLKGPQGTLFGANSTGGAIIFRPNKPSDRYEAYAQLGFGNFGRKEFQGMVNIPVNEALQLRVAGEVVRRNGFQINLTPRAAQGNRDMDNDKHESARVSARFKFSDTVLNDTVIDYYHRDDQPIIPTAIFLRNFDLIAPVNWARAGITVIPPSAWQIRVPTDNPTWNKARMYGLANTTSWEISPNVTFKNVIGYRKDATDQATNQSATGVPSGAGPAITSGGRVTYDSKQWTVEPALDVTWGDGRWHNKTGVFYSWYRTKTGISYWVNQFPFDFTGQPASVVGLVNFLFPLGVNETPDATFKSYAIYDQLALKLSDTLTFTAGLRYTRDKGDYTNRYLGTFNGGAGIPGLGPWGDFSFGTCDGLGGGETASLENFNAAKCIGSRSLRSSAPSFTLSMESQFAARKLLYATLRGGYLVGGFNNGVAVHEGQVYAPEKVTAFEGGLKADWDAAGGPLRTNVAVFYGTYKDQQRVEFHRVTGSNAGYAAVRNAGSTRFYGTDVDLTYAPSRFLELALSYNYLIAEYTQYNAPLSGIPGITNAAIDLTGTQEAEAPRNLLTASATIHWPLPEKMGELSTTLSYFHRSSTLTGDSPTVGGHCAGNTVANPVTECTAPGTFIPDAALDFRAFDVLPATGIANFAANWTGIAGTHLDAQLWVKNLSNKVYPTFIVAQVFSQGYVAQFTGDPRTYGLSLRYSF